MQTEIIVHAQPGDEPKWATSSAVRDAGWLRLAKNGPEIRLSHSSPVDRGYVADLARTLIEVVGAIAGTEQLREIAAEAITHADELDRQARVA